MAATAACVIFKPTTRIVSPVRLYTVEQANEVLPQVREHVAALREALERHQFVREQVDDLERHWADAVKNAGSPEHEERARLSQEASELEGLAEAELEALHELGVEVKDPVIGLVDFFAERDGELVYLCWREGEERVAHWHKLGTGFAGREPI